MTLKQLFDEYYLDTKEGKRLVEVFPDFYQSMEEMDVIPWDKELEEIYDRNPEVIDTMEYIRIMRQNGMMTEEEAKKMLDELPRDYSSKVMGVAYIEDKTVSFRGDKVPRLDVLIHEAGHIYFKVNDLYWSSTYGGGEYLMALILNGYVKGNEETVKNYIDMLKLINESPERANNLLNRFAEEFFEKINCFNCPEKKNALALMISAGTLPSGFTGDYDNPPDEMSKEDMHSFVVDMLEGIRWNDNWWRMVGEEFLKKLDIYLLENSFRGPKL